MKSTPFEYRRASAVNFTDSANFSETAGCDVHERSANSLPISILCRTARLVAFQTRLPARCLLSLWIGRIHANLRKLSRPPEEKSEPFLLRRCLWCNAGSIRISVASVRRTSRTTQDCGLFFRKTVVCYSFPDDCGLRRRYPRCKQFTAFRTQ